MLENEYGSAPFSYGYKKDYWPGQEYTFDLVDKKNYFESREAPIKSKLDQLEAEKKA